MKAKKLRGFRRGVILFYLEEEKAEYLEFIAPEYYEEDMDLLKKSGLVKERELTPEGRKVIEKIPQKTKRRMRRVILSRQNR